MNPQTKRRRGFAYVSFSASAILLIGAFFATLYMFLGFFSQMSLRFVILFLVLIALSNALARLAYAHLE
jgi:hypothetical protein